MADAQGMSTTDTALAAHVVMPCGYPIASFMSHVAQELHGRCHIVHPTLQMEAGMASIPVCWHRMMCSEAKMCPNAPADSLL